MSPDVSIIVEWANVKLAGETRAGAMMRRLGEELRGVPRDVEVLLCHDGTPPPAAWLEACELPRVWRMVDIPDAEYYALRNRGAHEAAGAILVFLDSDAIPETGWLEGVLAPFNDPAVDVVAGHAYIEPGTLCSRAFALTWFFPLRAGPEPVRPVTRFFANNVAFRRDVFLAHPFKPLEGSSRGACVALAAELCAAGITIWKTTAAQVSHPAPRGGRHFALRALAQGRDRLTRERGWRATILGSVARFADHCGAGLVSTLRNRRCVGLSLAGVPGVLVICGAYYGLAFIGEAATVLGLPWIRRVRV